MRNNFLVLIFHLYVVILINVIILVKLIILIILVFFFTFYRDQYFARAYRLEVFSVLF